MPNEKNGAVGTLSVMISQKLINGSKFGRILSIWQILAEYLYMPGTILYYRKKARNKKIPS